MSKLYIISKVDYQYNDEIYYRQGDGVVPLTAYKSKAKAAKECMKLNIKEFSNTNIGGYGYDIDDIVNDPFVIHKLADKYGITWIEDEFYETGSAFADKFASMIPEDQQLFYDNVNIKFFEVVEIEQVN